MRSLIVYYRPPKPSQWKRFYRNLLPTNPLVFDVGAHVGSKTRFLRKAGAKVVALEPQQPFASFLRRTLPRDVVFIDSAAGSSETEANMSISSLNPTVSSLKKDFLETANNSPGFENVVWDKSQRVKVLTLDSLIQEHGVPDYIKIDVEGFELEVLSGLSHAVDLISFEFLPGFADLTHEVVGQIETLGDYEFNLAVGEKANLIWDTWLNSKELKDWINQQPANSKSADVYARKI